MMRILILGGNGFIGRNLTASLLKAGAEVHICDRPDTSSNEDDASRRLFFHYGDLSTIGFVHKCLQKGPFDWVIHLACSLIPSSNFEDFIRERELNLTAGFELTRAMEQYGSRKLLFFSSGGAIYGNNGLSINDETSPLSPLNHYGFAKLAMEEFIRFQARSQHIEYIIVRPSNPYGSGQNLYGKQGLIAVTLGKLIQEKAIEIWGDGQVVRDYLHISDLCSAIQMLIDSTITNETFNIGSGKGTSVNEVLQTIRNVTGNKLPIDYLPSRSIDVPVNVLDISKIQQLTGWKTAISLDKGIAELWKEMRVSLLRF
jgi:UDP-glucose 4-epimerase